MDLSTRRYFITAYSEWETLDVEAQCSDDENAMDKALRYGSLKYVGRNFPPVIFAHVACDEPNGLREVGTWEYQVRHVKKTRFIWHDGSWVARPLPGDNLAIRRWAKDFLQVR